jgi:4-amino-4-deoxy-L-arabinose transferase-like glycosyltransferase
VIGAALRLGNLGQVAVEHFDEAVYASNLLFGADQGGEYPLRQFYAPPLLPAAIEWTTVFGQLFFRDLPTWWPMLPALVAGLATIPSAWWIARQWLSPRAGIIAAILIASHEFHAAYCRTALTDVPLTLFMLWAVHRFWIALQTGTVKDAAIAGAVTSLAWWTKYNGWLPLAIAGAGGVCWQLVRSRESRNWISSGRVWLIAVATAFLLWLPVLWDAQKVGGYSKIAENHRGYITGFSRWHANLIVGYQSFDEFAGWLSFAGLVLAGVFFVASRRNEVFDGISNRDAGDSLLAPCLIGAWFWGLFVATPMYHPYSRLWLPWLVSSALLIAAATMPGRRRSLPSPLARWGQQSLMATAAGCGVLYFAAACSGRAPLTVPASLESRAALRDAARKIVQHVGTGDSTYIVGHSDPALWYHLMKLRQAAFTSSSLDVVDGRTTVPRYVILGPLSQRDATLGREFKQREDRLELVEEYPIHLSRVAVLDLFSPADLAVHPERRTQTVKLFRVR